MVASVFCVCYNPIKILEIKTRDKINLVKGFLFLMLKNKNNNNKKNIKIQTGAT